MSAHQLSCEETLRRLAEFLDRELSPAEMLQVEQHLATCEQCARERRFEQAILDEMRAKLRAVAVPSDLVTRIKLAITG